MIEDDSVEELPSILTDLQINDEPFTIDELKFATSNLCEGKSAGPDDIPPEVIKRCNLNDIILSFANKLLMENVKPEQWSEIDLLPIPKSGDLSNTGNL